MIDDGPPTTGRAVAALLRAQDGLDRARGELLAAGGARWVSAGADRYRESLDRALADVALGTIALGRARWAVLRHLEAADVALEEAARERAAWLIHVPVAPHWTTTGGPPTPVYGPPVPAAP